MKLRSLFRKGIYSVSVMQFVFILSSVFISAIECFTIFLQIPSPRTSKSIQKQTADVQLNLDFILSMFEIIQTRKKNRSRVRVSKWHEVKVVSDVLDKFKKNCCIAIQLAYLKACHFGAIEILR